MRQSWGSVWYSNVFWLTINEIQIEFNILIYSFLPLLVIILKVSNLDLLEQNFNLVKNAST